MPKRTPDSKPAPHEVEPLPKAREALALLLRASEKVLDFLEPALQGQRVRLTELRRTLQEPRRIVEQRPYLQAVAQANQNRFARGGPSMHALMVYLDGSQLGAILEKHRLARTRMETTRPKGPGSLHAWKPCIDALAAIVAADQAVIDLIRDLQRRVISALDEVESLRADKETDRYRPSAARVPQNMEVVRLAHEIGRSSCDSVSQVEVALQFTDGDKQRADNLLRQVRRFGLIPKKRRR